MAPPVVTASTSKQRPKTGKSTIVTVELSEINDPGRLPHAAGSISLCHSRIDGAMVVRLLDPSSADLNDSGILNLWDLSPKPGVRIYQNEQLIGKET